MNIFDFLAHQRRKDLFLLSKTLRFPVIIIRHISKTFYLDTFLHVISLADLFGNLWLVNKWNLLKLLIILNYKLADQNSRVSRHLRDFELPERELQVPQDLGPVS